MAATAAASTDTCGERIARCEALVTDTNTALIDALKVNTMLRAELGNLNAELAADDKKIAADTVALDSWYHNPVIVGVLGVLVGGASYAIFIQHR